MSDFRSSFALEELLDEPFGPFREIDALTPRVRSTTLKNPLVLKCVSLEAGPGVVTGYANCSSNVHIASSPFVRSLDECEQCQPGYDKERFDHGLQVLFTGILDIDSFSWLTPRAIDTIESSIRERDYNARLAIDPRARRRDKISTESLREALGRSSKKVKIIIKATKYPTASFMQCTDSIPSHAFS